MVLLERKKKELAELTELYDKLSEVIKRLRNAIVTETDPEEKFKLEEKLKVKEDSREKLENDIQKLEQQIGQHEFKQPARPTAGVARSKNPYHYGKAVPHNYVGREYEIKEIGKLLASDTNVSILGDRKMGKSTLLNQLLDTYGNDYLWLCLDGQRVKDEADFFRQALKVYYQALNQPPPDKMGNPKDAFEELLYRNPTTHPLVLAIDELDLLTTKDFGQSFFNFLRSLAVDRKIDLRYVTFSKLSLATTDGRSQFERERKDRDISSPFFNIFTEFRLKPFRAEEREALFDLAKSVNLDLESERDRILEMAGHLPYFLQMACWLYVDSWQEKGAFDVDSIQRKFGKRAKNQFEYIATLGLSDEEMAIVHHLAADRVVERNTTYQRLVERGYIIGDRLFSTAFARYVKTEIKNAKSQY